MHASGEQRGVDATPEAEEQPQAQSGTARSSNDVAATCAKAADVPCDEDISSHDQEALWMQEAKARGCAKFDNDEKLFLIREMRLYQAEKQLHRRIVPPGPHIDVITAKGIENGSLCNIVYTDLEYREKARGFLRQFVRMYGAVCEREGGNGDE